MELIEKYFTRLTDTQKKQFGQLFDLYKEWNEKINVISRKDIDNLYLHHVLHSLAIAKFIRFRDGQRVMDIGTGGGFPGVPLAIYFPKVEFLLVDSVNKKLKVIDEVSEAIGLENVTTMHSRVEDVPFKFDFIVTRAVADIGKLNYWMKGKYYADSKHDIRNGLIALKGGDIEGELKRAKMKATIKPISDYFDNPYYKGKSIVYIRKGN